MTKPNFMVIGAPRCGTTFISRNLMHHPDVYLHHSGAVHSSGDMHFFDVSRQEGRENQQRGLEWYFSHFRSALAVGEKTADYLCDPLAPELIAREVSPDIKLVALFREPVSRAVSHFRYMQHVFPEGTTFMEVFDNIGGRWEDIWLKESGFYFRNVSRYIEVFGRDNIHLIDYKDINEEPDKVMQTLCRFLGIDASFVFPDSGKAINKNVEDGRVKELMLFGSRFKESFPRFFSLVDNVGLLWPVKRLIHKAKTLESPYRRQRSELGTTLSSGEHAALVETYRNDAERFSALLGKDLVRQWWG